MITASIPQGATQAPASTSSFRQSAQALETAFLAEMLKSAGIFRPSEELGGGAGEEQFTSFLADAQARAIVARGGLGLSDAIERSLMARGEPV